MVIKMLLQWRKVVISRAARRHHHHYLVHYIKALSSHWRILFGHKSFPRGYNALSYSIYCQTGIRVSKKGEVI